MAIGPAAGRRTGVRGQAGRQAGGWPGFKRDSTFGPFPTTICLGVCLSVCLTDAAPTTVPQKARRAVPSVFVPSPHQPVRMGHSASRPTACAGAGDGEALPSRFARFRRRLRNRLRRGAGDDSVSSKALAADEFAGIARVRIAKVRGPRAANSAATRMFLSTESRSPLRRGQPRRNQWVSILSL